MEDSSEVLKLRRSKGYKWCHLVCKKLVTGIVVVAQLTARLPPILDDPGSNLVMGNFY